MKNVFNKLLVVGAAVLLTAICASAAIKFGTDSTGQKWYGQTGDLITNSKGKAFAVSASGLQNAIWDLNSTDGGSVNIPVGDILLTSTIYVPERIDISGASMNETRLNWQGNNVVCFNFSGTGNEYGGSLKNMYLYNGGTGVYVSNMIEFSIDKCKIAAMKDYGIRTTGTSYHTMVSQCRIVANTSGTGIYFGANGEEATGCDFAGFNGSTCVNISSSGVSLTSNWFEIGPSTGNVTTRHIVINGGDVSISGNFIGGTRNGGDQILVMGSSSSISICNNYISGANKTAIRFSGTGTYITITGNVITNFHDYAILISSSAYGFSISGNDFYTNDGDAKGFISANTLSNALVVTGNYFRMSAAANIYACTYASIFSNNYVFRCGGAYNCHNVQNNYISCGNTATVDYGVSNCNIVNNNYINNVKIGIGVYNEEAIVSNNKIGTLIGTYCIYVSAVNCSIINNQISNTNTNIRLTSSADYCYVFGNIIKGPLIDEGSFNTILFNRGNMTIFPTYNMSGTGVYAGFAWYDVTNHKLWVYEGAGVWKSSTFT